VSFDPNIGFDVLTFTTECLVCTLPPVSADFSQIAGGQSVEGMGVVAPGLNIDAKGTAVKVVEGQGPVAYAAGVGNTILNGGMFPGGGFADTETRTALQPHLFTFTFDEGITVSQFTLRMLDFGDWNLNSSPSTYVSMTAYDANGVVVSIDELSYTSTAYNSPKYGDLFVAGDAMSAVPGEPGNWTWNVSGSGIVKVVLEFGVGFDPNIGFDVLTFTPECSTTTSTIQSQLESRYMLSNLHFC
jgi:hypothetical protein